MFAFWLLFVRLTLFALLTGMLLFPLSSRRFALFLRKTL
jgi:hypothetical protein